MEFEHINDLVRRFRDGDPFAAEELLELFQPLIQRMYRFLRYGHLGGDPILVGLCKVYGDGNQAEGARIIAERLRYMEDEELLAEVHYCFLTAAHTSSTLQYGFRRNIARRVGHLLSRKRRDIVYLEELPESVPADRDGLNFIRWVIGETCSELFADLSQEHRELLYRRIVLEEPFSQIADEMGMSEREAIQLYNRLIKRLRCSVMSGGNDGSEDSSHDCTSVVPSSDGNGYVLDMDGGSR